MYIYTVELWALYNVLLCNSEKRSFYSQRRVLLNIQKKRSRKKNQFHETRFFSLLKKNSQCVFQEDDTCNVFYICFYIPINNIIILIVCVELQFTWLERRIRNYYKICLYSLPLCSLCNKPAINRLAKIEFLVNIKICNHLCCKNHPVTSLWAWTGKMPPSRQSTLPSRGNLDRPLDPRTWHPSPTGRAETPMAPLSAKLGSRTSSTVAFRLLATANLSTTKILSLVFVM